MKDAFISVNGINLHYVEEGSGELVILLHGFPEFWYTWRNQIPELSQKYRVVAVDLRGYNLSDKPISVYDYRIPLLVEDIAQLIRSQGTSRAFVVGHDWGGIIAWMLAAKDPELVEKLVVLNTPHPMEMRRAFFEFNIMQWLRSYYIFLFQLPWLPEYVIGSDLRKFFVRHVLKDATHGVVEKYVEAYSQPGVLTSTLNCYRAAMRHLSDLKTNSKLTMPVLMLWGERDPYLGKDLAYRTKDYCGSLEIIFDPTSGHFIQHENPEFVNTKLLEFFSK